MFCPDCRTFSVSKNLNIARGFFGVLAAILFLSTLIVLGANMDYANYPGSNMVLKLQVGGDNDGEFVKLKDGDGFEIIAQTECASNFASVVTGTSGEANGFCGTVENDIPKALIVKDEDGKEVSGKRAYGWTIMPPCVKTDKLSDCAPFGIDSALSGLGQATFGVLAINAALTAAHTGVELGRPESLTLNTATILFGLNILWGILSFSLFVWSAVGWRGFCDKIDTGLGRHVDGAIGCATTYCTISYGGFFASFATALVVYRVPDLLVMFGVLGLESADDYAL